MKAGKLIAALLTGMAIGTAVGYVLATDKEERSENLGKLKDKLSDMKDSVKDRFSKTPQDLEAEIYNA